MVVCKFILLVFSGGDSLLFYLFTFFTYSFIYFFIIIIIIFFQIQLLFLLLLKYISSRPLLPPSRLGVSVPRTLGCFGPN